MKKTRIVGKLMKTYDKPKTPYDRLLDCGKLSANQVQVLKAIRAILNPLTLKEGLDTKLRLFSERLRRLQTTQGDRAIGRVS